VLKTPFMRLASLVPFVALASLAACGGSEDASDDDAADTSEELGAVLAGADTNGSTMDLAAARARGASFVGRYLSFDGAHPALSAAEVARFRAGGMPLFAIWETGQKRTIELGSEKAEHAAGVMDATYAKQALVQVGAAGKPVYFTVDFDVTPAIWTQKGHLVLAYFEGVNSVIGVARTGAYGTYATIKGLFDAGKIRYGWQQTFGGRGAKTDKRAQLRQFDIYPDPTGWGVSGAGALDLDRAVAADFGQF
jgi:hypothetical protein